MLSEDLIMGVAMLKLTCGSWSVFNWAFR